MEYSAPFPFGQQVIDPIFDIGFKLIFGRERVSEPLLIDLLNSIFEGDPEYGNIISVKYTNTEYPNEWIEGKGIRYDIRCETADHRHFIVEMQKGEQEHFLERSCYYVDRAIASQGYRGRDDSNREWDFSLEPVVGVFFCNFHVRELEHKPVVKARLMDQETHTPVGNFKRQVYIQIPYFKNEEDECKSQLEKWIYNIKNMGRMQKVAFTYEDTFEYLDSVSDVAMLPPEERDIYEAELMKARDYYAIMKTAQKKATEKGLAEGRAKGLKQGLEQGRAEGLAEGRAEGHAEGVYTVARNMIDMGMELNLVSQATGLSIEELSILKK